MFKYHKKHYILRINAYLYGFSCSYVIPYKLAPKHDLIIEPKQSKHP